MDCGECKALFPMWYELCKRENFSSDCYIDSINNLIIKKQKEEFEELVHIDDFKIGDSYEYFN